LSQYEEELYKILHIKEENFLIIQFYRKIYAKK